MDKKSLTKENIEREKVEESKEKIIENKIVKETKDKIKEPKEKQSPKIKRIDAFVQGKNLPISMKYSISICKFIKNKKILEAIKDLEQVLNEKKAVPMKGEIPHRKGKKMMSGRFPKKATEHFIQLLKSLLANARELNEPIIIEAIANIGERPFGRFGRIRRKRTHIKIKAIEREKIPKKKLNKKRNKHDGRKKHNKI